MDRTYVFPVALALAWVVAVGVAMTDFAGFEAATRPARRAAAVEVVTGHRPMARAGPKLSRTE